MPEKGEVLDDRLKELMQELGNAINESLSESDRIAGAIGEIKRAGYDVFLVLEATIGFNKREDDADTDSETAEHVEPASPRGSSGRRGAICGPSANRRSATRFRAANQRSGSAK